MVGEEGRVNVVERSLGKVSVVQIARAVVSQASWELEREDVALGMAERIFWIGSRCPITPVDITRAEFGEGVGMKVSFRVEAMEWASLRPAAPVTALAQPELMITPRIPSPHRSWRVSLLTTTGAAARVFLVKTAAAEQGRSEVRRARSGKRVFEALTPTWVPETKKPLG